MSSSENALDVTENHGVAGSIPALGTILLVWIGIFLD